MHRVRDRLTFSNSRGFESPVTHCRRTSACRFANILEPPLFRNNVLSKKHFVDLAKRFAFKVHTECRGASLVNGGVGGLSSAGKPVIVQSARNSCV